MSSTLGIGSRVNHPAYGKGAVIRLHKAAYEICFMMYGIKHVGYEYDKWEVIEAIPAEESISFSEAEKALIKILQTYNGLEEIVDLGDKWLNGNLITDYIQFV